MWAIAFAWRPLLATATSGAMPVVTVSFPEVVARLPMQAQVWIDDGKIRARVVGVEGADRIVEVVGARAKGEKLRLEKGVNFPGTPLDLPALSADDFAALPPSPSMRTWSASPSSSGRATSPISTGRSSRSGPVGRRCRSSSRSRRPRRCAICRALIVQAAGSRPTAVMIARGDLAVELGHIRMAEIQEEILWLCEAARIPVVWATQVLDDLVKEGLPSRAETTDAAMAQRAECVMLNKGPHVVEAIRFLSDIIGKMSRHQSKKYRSPRRAALLAARRADDRGAPARRREEGGRLLDAGRGAGRLIVAAQPSPRRPARRRPAGAFPSAQAAGVEKGVTNQAKAVKLRTTNVKMNSRVDDATDRACQTGRSGSARPHAFGRARPAFDPRPDGPIRRHRRARRRRFRRRAR